jgi:alkylated DNA repair dioxygenase AlkB
MQVAVAGQLSLLGRQAPGFDPTFAGVSRRHLDRSAWVDHCPQWVSGQATLLAELTAAMRWRAHCRRMYDRIVAVPRLTADVPEDGPGHAVLPALGAALASRYAAPLSVISLALYRDGADSVAYHRDTELCDRDEAIVAIVSLGDARTFAMRPRDGGAATTWSFGWGDLLVMGGTSQRDWEHAVPKVRCAAPRMAVMFREVQAPPTYLAQLRPQPLPGG